MNYYKKEKVHEKAKNEWGIKKKHNTKVPNPDQTASPAATAEWACLLSIGLIISLQNALLGNVFNPFNFKQIKLLRFGVKQVDKNQISILKR